MMILEGTAVQVLLELGLGGLGSSLATVTAGLRSHQFVGLLILCSTRGSKFSNPGSLQSISTRTFLVWTILRIHLLVSITLPAES